MKKQLSNLTLEEKELISRTILTSAINDVKELYFEQELYHRNAYSMMVWDFIGTNIIKNLKNTRLKVEKVKRGYFSFDLIVDEDNSTVYSVIKKSNLERVRNSKKFSHYCYALASINSDIDIQEGQMNLFSADGIEDFRETIKADLLSDIGSIINRYGTIVINDDNKQFPSVELHVLDMNLNSVYTEVWKQNIEVDYSNNYAEYDEKSEDKISLSIKVNKDDNNVKIKREEEKKKVL